MTVNYKFFFGNPQMPINIDFHRVFHKVVHNFAIDSAIFPLYILGT